MFGRKTFIFHFFFLNQTVGILDRFQALRRRTTNEVGAESLKQFETKTGWELELRIISRNQRFLSQHHYYVIGAAPFPGSSALRRLQMQLQHFPAKGKSLFY